MATNGMNVSLELAKRLSETVNAAWESGELMEQVTPTTQELLKFCSRKNIAHYAIGTSMQDNDRLSSTLCICTR